MKILVFFPSWTFRHENLNDFKREENAISHREEKFLIERKRKTKNKCKRIRKILERVSDTRRMILCLFVFTIASSGERSFRQHASRFMSQAKQISPLEDCDEL